MTKFKIGDRITVLSSDGLTFHWGTIDKISLVHSAYAYYVTWDHIPGGGPYEYLAQIADNFWELPTRGPILFQNQPSYQPIPVASVMGKLPAKFKVGDRIKYCRPLGIGTKYGVITRVEGNQPLGPSLIKFHPIYHILWDNSSGGVVGDKYDVVRADQIWELETQNPTVSSTTQINSKIAQFRKDIEDHFIKSSNPKGSSVCDHKWVKYQGLSISYNFCEKCDQKAVLDEI